MILYRKGGKFSSGPDMLRYAKVSKETKEMVQPYLLSSTTYRKGRFFGLAGGPAGGFDMGADEKGFFIYTHRARSKSFETPGAIPEKVKKFIEGTG